MLIHASPEAVRPPRVVILGATGVIGRALALYLKDRDEATVPIGSRDLDLLRDDAPEQLAARLSPDDAVVVLAGIPPRRGRDLATMVKNVQMGIHICAALARRPVAHVLYMSSDAVYPRPGEEVTESSPTEPSDPYSAMHLIRERMFRGLISVPVAILRTTQVSAFDDTHDAYGPNRFRRTARQEGRIVLFGRGEETRDHIMANDVASLIHLCLMHRSHGVMNVATGRSLTFAEVADIVSAGFDPAPLIEHAPRQIPLTHRRFDISACARAFPGFTFTPLESGEEEIRRLLKPVPSVR
jgi:nucleoside-diphosphate-sugar epimerase